MNDCLPNLFLVGAQKSGTTALATVLATHSDIYLPKKKEPFYFCQGTTYESGIYSYINIHYNDEDLPIWRLDASTSYMVIPSAAELIADTVGDNARFIAILRHPVDRIQSAFTYFLTRKDNFEYNRTIKDLTPSYDNEKKIWSLDKLIAWESESIRLAQENRQVRPSSLSWKETGFPLCYIRTSRYSEHIMRYYSMFDRDRFYFIKFDDFVKDQDLALRGLAKFLNIDYNKFFMKEQPVKANETVGYSASFTVRLRSAKRILKPFVPLALQRVLVNAERRLIEPKPVTYEFSKTTRLWLEQLFDEDIQRTSELTGLDLRDWRR